MQENSTFRLMNFLLFLFIAVNLFILDIKLFSSNKYLSTTSIPNVSPAPYVATPTDTTKLTTFREAPLNNSCPVSCVNLITDATKSALPNIGAPGQIATTNQPPLTSKTYYIPLGSGSTTKSDWDDLSATETIIDTVSYGTVKEAQMSYALNNPTQNGKVGVRLYNVTDKYVVYGSEAELGSGTSQTINTNTFAFPIGNKLYRIQMRSTLSYDAYLENAKLKIVTQ